VGFLEGDQSGCELEECEVVLFFLRPADQERPVAVEPGVAGLHDPAAGAPARGVQLVLDLVSAGADVRCELALIHQLAHERVVVAAVEAQSLRPPLTRLGPLDRD